MTRTPTETVLDVATAGLVARVLHVVAELGDAVEITPTATPFSIIVGRVRKGART